MFFDLDLMASTITVLYIKMPIADFIMYVGAVIGMYKNYKKNCEIAEKQLEQLELKGQELEAAKAAQRQSFIKDNAKALFLKVEQIAAKTEMTGDDKLVKYIKNFIEGMSGAFGAAPTEDELKLMKDKAFQYDLELKISKGEEIAKPDKEVH